MAKGVMFEDLPGMAGRRVIIDIERQFSAETEGSVLQKALVKAAQLFAEKWLEENRDKIIERLNVDALASMILLEAAKQTKDDILGSKK